MNRLVFFLVIVAVFSCKEKVPVEHDYQFRVVNSGESDVSIDWRGDGSDSEVLFLIGKDESFGSSVSSETVSISEGTVALGGLDPMSKYFIKIEVFDDDEIVWSEVLSFHTRYTTLSVNYMSSISAEICADIKYISTRLSDESDVVVFMHAYSSDKSSWDVTGIPDTLIGDGNICISFDFKGHGCTENSEVSGFALIDEPWLLREDFDSTLAYFRGLGLDHSGEIIVFGESMGASIATAVSSYENVIGGVAASSVARLARDSYLGRMQPAGMFYVAGEMDKNESRDIDYEEDAYSLRDSTRLPSMVRIISGSYKHGVGLFEENAYLIPLAIDWVRDLE